MRYQHIAAMVLALLMCILPLAGCTSKGNSPSETSGLPEPAPTESTAAPIEQPTQLKVIENGKTDYVIVRSASAEPWEIELAMLFRNTMKSLTGIDFPIVDDFEREGTSEVRREKEIVIGKTNRENEYTVDYGAIGCGYTVFVAQNRLVLTAGSQSGLFFAIQNFFRNYYELDIENEQPEKLDYIDLTVSANYRAQQRMVSSQMPFMEANFEEYTINYDGSLMGKRTAFYISDAIRLATGGSLKREAIKRPDETTFLIENKKPDGGEILPGQWFVQVDNKTIHLCASDYNGFSGLSHYLKTSAKWGYYRFSDGFTASGDYLTTLDEVTSSTAYAYTRKGDIRILFYNVLWMNTTGKHGSENDVPAKERTPLQYEMISQYMPDVLGLQEMGKTNREEAGEQNFAALLEKLGYAETVSPNVATPYQINCTPLFYNTNTTDYLAGDFYWYQNHQSNIDAGDQSSKALTWGVFADKRTSSRYIVISTHMCTRDDNIRLEQAKEAVQLIERLVEQYRCPVFLGGDFNGTRDSLNYKHFISSGLLDVMDEADVSSDTDTHHPYPRYNPKIGMMLPNGGASLGTNSIDHILMANGEDVSLNLYGVIADDCTASASDHFPMITDFSFKQTSEDIKWSDRY